MYIKNSILKNSIFSTDMFNCFYSIFPVMFVGEIFNCW